MGSLTVLWTSTSVTDRSPTAATVNRSPFARSSAASFRVIRTRSPTESSARSGSYTESLRQCIGLNSDVSPCSSRTVSLFPGPFSTISYSTPRASPAFG